MNPHAASLSQVLAAHVTSHPRETTTAAIAEGLGISPQTLRGYIRGIVNGKPHPRVLSKALESMLSTARGAILCKLTEALMLTMLDFVRQLPHEDRLSISTGMHAAGRTLEEGS